MWGWFGGASAQQRKEGPKNAILLLRQQLDMLQKRERHLETQITDQENLAKKSLSGNNRTAAMNAVRRKKVHERSLKQTNDQIGQVEQQIYSIEAANINQETFNAMKAAGKAMKDIHGNLTVEKVDQAMDELRDQHDISEQITTSISGTTIGEPIDEDELEAELEGMEQEALDERMVKTGTVPVADLPGVANGPIKGKNKVTPEEEDEEEELRKLQAEMAM